MRTPRRRLPSSPLRTSSGARQSAPSGSAGMYSAAGHGEYAERPSWEPARLRFRLSHFLLAWALSALSLLAAAAIVPGVSIPSFGAAVLVAAFVGVLNALLPPIVAALRLPLTVVIDFVLLLVIDAWILVAASNLDEHAIQVSSFWSALFAALVASAVGIVLNVLFGVDDDETYTFRVIHRIARRSRERVETDVPGIVFLEI